MVKQGEGADPAAVVFDAANSFRKQNADFLIVDTAGRLHNKKNLLDELAKINRVIDREMPSVNRETLLVLDGVTGQNGLMQAKEFTNAASISGIVLTKLDGTAKGGIVLAIKRELGIPVKLIGVGEGAEDLQPFNSGEFVRAMFEEN
jgi:fused signal recognition particle receptor